MVDISKYTGSVTAMVVTDETAKAIEQFHDFKYIIKEISESAGVDLNDQESFAMPVILLRNLLGEDKFKVYMNKLRITSDSHLN